MANFPVVRCLLIAFNVTFCVIGLVLIGFGAWFIADANSLLKIFGNIGLDTGDLGSFNSLLIGVGAGVITIGFVMAVTAMFGCLGALKGNRCMLGIFFGILLLLFGACVACGVLALTQEDIVKLGIREIMALEVENNNDDGLYAFSFTEYNCCGYEVEQLCSMTYGPIIDGVTMCQKGSPKCSSNCVDALWDGILNVAALALGATLLTICGIQLFGMFMALCMCFRTGGNYNN